MKKTGDNRYRPALQRGFTLLEILIAMALLGISITVLTQLFSANLRNISSSQQYVPALAVAEAIMSEILASDPLEETLKNYLADDGYKVEIAVSEALKDRTQNLPVKLMEIDLTLRWTIDQKEKTFHLKTYRTLRRSDVQGEIRGKEAGRESSL